MSNHIDIEVLLEKELNNNWNNDVDVLYANGKTQALPDEYLNYIYFTGSAQNITLGSVKTREFCSLMGEIRVERHTGTKRAMELAEEFATIFRNKTIGIIKLFEANFERITDESHYGVNVLIPFWWDRT